MSKHHYHRKGQNRHHLTPKSRGGQSTDSNLLWIKIERHQYWHKVFGNLTLDEVIKLLQKLKELKDAQKNKFNDYYH
jgi:hypothetical protein